MTVQSSIFDFHDRILPKIKRTIAITDWDGEPERLPMEDAEAMVSAIHDTLTTKGHHARFMPEKRYNHDSKGNCTTVKESYISYWIMHSFYFADFDYITGERTKQCIRVCKPKYANGKEIGTNLRTPADAYIENDTLFIDCTDGNTYTAIIDENADIDPWDIQEFDPTVHTEHLLLDLFIKGARGDELLPVMTFGPCSLTELHGHIEQDCRIQDIAQKYGIDLRMMQTVRAWSPEHYPIQETCRNCTRYRKESKTCQIEGKNAGDGYICCFDWHWDGKPFKKVKKKKKVEEDEDWEEEE